MRIVAGRWRGKQLTPLGHGDVQANPRPTTDRVRENIFNLLQNGRQGDVITGARVLDIFAGTGALGIEALSRGAQHASFIENGRAAQKLLAANIKRCAAQGMTSVIAQDVTTITKPAVAAYDVILLDPPYRSDLGQKGLVVLTQQGWIAQGAIVMWEDATPPIWPAGFHPLDQRKYGGTIVSLAQYMG
jgi:16S rRNA (guanine966-N2)-methyltransferase